MGKQYRVMLIEVGAESDETVFELLGSATMLARLTPQALADALIDNATGLITGDPSPAAMVQPGETEAPKPARTRRTKAQIAADEAAAEAARIAAGGPDAGLATGGVPDGVIVPERATAPTEGAGAWDPFKQAVA